MLNDRAFLMAAATMVAVLVDAEQWERLVAELREQPLRLQALEYAHSRLAVLIEDAKKEPR